VDQTEASIKRFFSGEGIIRNFLQKKINNELTENDKIIVEYKGEFCILESEETKTFTFRDIDEIILKQKHVVDNNLIAHACIKFFSSEVLKKMKILNNSNMLWQIYLMKYSIDKPYSNQNRNKILDTNKICLTNNVSLFTMHYSTNNMNWFYRL
jgi:hypothetical protein